MCATAYLSIVIVIMKELYHLTTEGELADVGRFPFIYHYRTGWYGCDIRLPSRTTNRRRTGRDACTYAYFASQGETPDDVTNAIARLEWHLCDAGTTHSACWM